jgi:hypothetical protein
MPLLEATACNPSEPLAVRGDALRALASVVPVDDTRDHIQRVIELLTSFLPLPPGSFAHHICPSCFLDALSHHLHEQARCAHFAT